jgi:hypothetical protein
MLCRNAGNKKHPDPKFKNQPEIMMYNMLPKNIEGHHSSAKGKSSMILKADVEQDAHASVVANFMGKQLRRKDDGDAPIKPS